MSNSYQPHGLQHGRLLCSSSAPGVCWLCWYLLSQWCHLTISSSAAPFFFCLHSFTASGALPVHLFQCRFSAWPIKSPGQNIPNLKAMLESTGGWCQSLCQPCCQNYCPQAWCLPLQQDLFETDLILVSHWGQAYLLINIDILPIDLNLTP